MTARTLPVVTVRDDGLPTITARAHGRPVATVGLGSALAMTVGGVLFSLTRVIFELVSEAGDHLTTEDDNRLVME